MRRSHTGARPGAQINSDDTGPSMPHPAGEGRAASGKLTIRCIGWRQLCRNTLRGFAAIQIADLRMTMHEVAVHERNGKGWAQPPSRPWVKDGRVVTDDAGKPQYSPLFEFDTAAVRAAFSDAVVRAVLAFDPRALECRESAA